MSDEITIGTEIDSFLVEYEVGRGGMGIVYLCYDSRAERPVALKILHSFYSAESELTKRFEREAKIVSTLEHPNIAKLYQYGKWKGRPYLVMEWIEGVTLKSLLLERGRLDLAHATKLVHQISDALAYAHDTGIVHRDLKPSNIMVRPDDTISLIDFGVAWREDTASITRPNSLIGTPLYMSPEQIQGDAVDIRTDIYSLGTIFYEMLLGKPPFGDVASQAVFHQHLYGDPPPLTEEDPTIPSSVETVIFKALQKSPEQRFASVYDFSSALTNPQNIHESNWSAAHIHGRPARAWIPMGIGTLVFLILLGVAYLGSRELTPSQTGKGDLGTSVIYDDELAESWVNWSWVTDNQHDRSESKSGMNSISVQHREPWGAFYIHAVEPVDLTEISALRFWINGGQEGGQLIRILLVDEAEAYSGDWSTPAHTIRAPRNSWELVEVPIEEFGSPPTTSGVAWQDGAGEPQPVYYLDQIEFVHKSQ